MSLGACFCFGDFGFRVGELGFSILSNFAKRSLALPVSLVSGASYLASLMVNVSGPALPVGALRARAAHTRQTSPGALPADANFELIATYQGAIRFLECRRYRRKKVRGSLPRASHARANDRAQSGTAYSQLWVGRVSR